MYKIVYQKNKISIIIKEQNGNAVYAKFICQDCNKLYSSASGLWKHKKICTNTILDPTEILDDDNKLISLILDVVKSNSELQKQNQDFQQQMLELCKNGIKVL